MSNSESTQHKSKSSLWQDSLLVLSVMSHDLKVGGEMAFLAGMLAAKP